MKCVGEFFAVSADLKASKNKSKVNYLDNNHVHHMRVVPMAHFV